MAGTVKTRIEMQIVMRKNNGGGSAQKATEYNIRYIKSCHNDKSAQIHGTKYRKTRATTY